MPRRSLTIPQALELLGIQPPSLDGVQTVDEAKQRCADFKAGPLARRWKELAKQHHPDLGTPEEVEARTVRMAELNEAYETVRDDLQIVVTRPAPKSVPMRQGFTVTIVRGGTNPWSPTSATTTGGGWEW